MGICCLLLLQMRRSVLFVPDASVGTAPADRVVSSADGTRRSVSRLSVFNPETVALRQAVRCAVDAVDQLKSALYLSRDRLDVVACTETLEQLRNDLMGRVPGHDGVSINNPTPKKKSVVVERYY